MDKYDELSESITPSYLLEEPYRNILIAIARGDGRFSNVFRKARIGESLGFALTNELVELGVVELEESREVPLKRYPNQKLKRSLRGYRIEAKIRYSKPFYQIGRAHV